MTTIYIGNEEININIRFDDKQIQYLGPENLVLVKKLNKIEQNVVYVDCFFRDENSRVYIEEYSIDLSDVLSEYTEVIENEYNVIVGATKDVSREPLR